MSRRLRGRLLTVALLVGLGAAAPNAVQAQTRARANAVFYHQGPYAGKITQVVPKPYSGRISLLVSQRKITGLTVTFGVACQSLGWVRDQDPMPTFTVAIGSAGGFSYTGKLAGRRMRLSGIFNGHKVVGSFFQSFWFGHDFCTMERPAFFTALG